MKRRDERVESKDKREGKAEEKEENGERVVLRGSKVRLKGELSLLAPRRGGPSETATTSTPVLPWKEGGGVAVVGGGAQRPPEAVVKPTPFSSLFLPPPPPPVPVRRIAAAFWEFVQYFSPPGTMQFGGDSDGYRIRPHQHHQNHQRRRHDPYFHHHRHQREKSNLGFNDRVNLGDPFQRSPEHQPATASSLRRQVAALLAQHHRSSEQNHHPPRLLSPAGYESSLEINPYNQASTPTSSTEFKGRIGELNHGFGTSTELLKVLNRIWTLEERHESNISLVKALKTELDHARLRIKELLRDQQASRHEIDDLMKQLAEDKLARKSKEQERINSTVQSLRDDLADERRLRKRSEGLHRRLSREIFEVKVALSTSLKQIERERTCHRLLEELCDEFAKGIIECEQQVHCLRQKTDKNWINDGDHLIIHMCESWIDERIQMKDQEEAESSGGFAGQDLVVDKLRHEIEAFLQARKMIAPRGGEKDSRLRRNSLESILLNQAGSAPRYGGNEDSAVSNSQLFEIKQMGSSKLDSHEGEVEKDPINTKKELSEATTAAYQHDKMQAVDSEIRPAMEENPVTEISTLQTSDKVGAHREGICTVDKMMSELLLSEGGSGIVGAGENKCREFPCNNANSASRRKAPMVSPVNKSKTSTAFQDLEIMESSSKNTLKAKLQEPKAKVGYGSRLKILKGSS